MPVYKYRSFEDAEKALWLPPGDARIPDAMRAVAQLGRLAPEVPPYRGVLRFKTIEAANLDRDAWEDKIIAAARARVVHPQL